MPVKIRLQRKGRKKAPFYHIVVADARAPRDGKYILRLGTYNPMTKPATIDLDQDQAYDWLMKGAQPTETVRSILRFKGVLYKKHLQRGVKKGAFSQEEADKKHAAWLESKEAKIERRKLESQNEKLAFYAKVNGIAPPKPIAVVEPEPVVEAPAPVVEEAPAAPEASTEPVVEDGGEA